MNPPRISAVKSWDLTEFLAGRIVARFSFPRPRLNGVLAVEKLDFVFPDFGHVQTLDEANDLP